MTHARPLRLRQEGLISGFGEWGGWDSNPGPADYESSLPAACPVWCDLGGRDLTRSWLGRFGHVFGMIMLDAARLCGLDLTRTAGQLWA